MRPGQTFEDADVAGFYRYRPDYSEPVFDMLLEINPGRSSLLDLGCGTGKIARRLAGSFDRVTGVDASRAMLRIATALQPETAGNITWVHGAAETAELPDAPFDLIVAAASIHWMDHAALFPRLSSLAGEPHAFAVVDGDGAFEPPWKGAWDDFLGYWIQEIKGERYQPDRADGAFRQHMERHRHWIDVAGEREVISGPVVQAVPDFIACQHSRDTFAPSRLGARLPEFDAALARVLEPHAVDGYLTYRVRTSVTWGRIRS